ncbi:MAG: 4-(cytidine 5'-diphospho)-2-C-methyl-D-erythritol kinase [Clostridiales bacterium]|nr:4-(cytidine 5'-diphospho)-2-C-methyl-D-erythritol kinase [Clostridiales bacterium]
MDITIKAAAKINLLLDLTSVLENGYHSIYTVMQSVDIFDKVTVALTEDRTISLSCSESSVPTDRRNTAYKAAEGFFEYLKKENKGVSIHIEKHIPSQAGMAGGSADAAAVIRALNILYEANLSEAEQFAIGEKIGADVPFCIGGGTRLCLNTGEVMAQIPNLPECFFVIVKPSQGVSTKEAYKSFDSAKWIRHPDRDGFLYAAKHSDLKGICSKAANVFEQVIEVPDRAVIKGEMRNCGAILSLMTGSGSAVFGLFERESDAADCAERLRKKFKIVFTAKPLPKGLFPE